MSKKTKITDIKFDDKNFNKGTEYGKSLMNKSLSKFGAGRSILIDKNNKIIAGNKTAETYGELGLEDVEIIETDGKKLIAVKRTDIDLDTPEGRELALADNQTSKVNLEWDYDTLDSELEESTLEEWGIEIPNEEELEAEEDDFDEIPPENPITVLGDLYEIGEHRLLCGDSTDSDQVAKLMNGEKADMVFTDPPYNVSIGTIKHPKFKQREIQNDCMSKDEFKDFCRGWASCISLFCDGIIYCWAGQGEDGRVMFTILDEMFHNSTTIIWAKDQFTLGRGKYHCQYEPCWFGWNKSGSTFTEDRTLSNLWNFKRPQKSELHPTMKPIELCENGLNHSSKQGDKVLDLFLGSGSTMVAAEQLNRKCYGMELDPKYCDVIVKRMLKLDPSISVKRNGKDCKSEFEEQSENISENGKRKN